MKFPDDQDLPSSQLPTPKSNELFNGGQTVAIFTVLSILTKMKECLGLEAMLEYIDTYLDQTTRRDPGIKIAVAKALNMMSIEKIYQEAISSRNE